MNRFFPFRPKLLECLRGYDRQGFLADLVAGMTVGIVALPLAMAFAIASGVPPQAGIFTAVIAGFIISALGGTRVCIGGPTGAFIVILYGIHAKYGPENLAICTIMAGVILLIMGAARLGTMIKYIPYPVTMGFTSRHRRAHLQHADQGFLRPAAWTRCRPNSSRRCACWPSTPAPSNGRRSLLAAALAGDHHASGRKAWQRRVPGSIVALVLGTLAVALFSTARGDHRQQVRRHSPGPAHPAHARRCPGTTSAHLVQPATTIALLAAIESLLCAVVADGMMDDRHDSNQELMAQGLANIVSPLFGGIAATGAIARTATNVRSGARTPVAGIIHALTLLVIILVAAPLARYIPLAALSAVLVNVALQHGRVAQLQAGSANGRVSDAAVFLTAFGLTVIIDLTVAVEIGMVLAAVLFIKRVSETTQITRWTRAPRPKARSIRSSAREIPRGVMVYRIFGSFFFGAADKLESALKRLKEEPEVLILRMRKVLAMDATGLNALEDLCERLRRKGKHLILSGPHTQPFHGDGKGRVHPMARARECLRPHRGLPGPGPRDSRPASRSEPRPLARREGQDRSRAPGTHLRPGTRRCGLESAGPGRNPVHTVIPRGCSPGLPPPLTR